MERYERLSNYVEPDKARQELEALKQSLLANTVQESDRPSARGPAVTHAEDGTPRVRVYLLDDDAYMGYIEDTAYVGIAFLQDEIVLEAYYPNRRDKLHVFYNYTESTGLTACHEETVATKGQDSLPMTPGREESAENIKHLIGYMRRLNRDMVMTYEWNYANELRQQDSRGIVPFVFDIEQLR